MNMPLTPTQAQAPAFGFDNVQKVFHSKDGSDTVTREGLSRGSDRRGPTTKGTTCSNT